jgi:hypothetical protein
MITQMLGFDADVYPVALSHDGTEMILYYDDDYIGNLYYSRMEDGLWSPATKLGEDISTKFWESHACFSRDGNTLYLTSNRKGTYGGLDIYMAEKQDDGKWGAPVNLGSTINTRYNEESPYISEDGKTLYFSSYGHYNMGGYDIFYSRKNEDGSWAEPVNMGYPINTTDDDLYFQPFDKGHAAYYSIYSPNGIGRHDIYYMNIYSVDNPRFYLISGNVRTEDGLEDPSRVSIYVVDTDSGDTLLHVPPDEEGAFAFQLKQGHYELRFSGQDYVELIRPLHINKESDKTGIRLEDELMLSLVEEEEEAVEPEVLEGEDSQIRLRETQVEAVAGTPVLVPVIAPKGSLLVIRTYQDSVLVQTDTLVTERRRTQLEIVPLPGNSEVELEFSDQDGNIHRNRLVVAGSAIEASDTPEEGEEMQPDQQPVIPAEPSLEDTEGMILLAGSVSGNDPEKLREQLAENSDGELNAYLEQLDPEAEGITNADELMLHLQEASRNEGFTIKEVRDALIRADQEEKKAAMLGLVKGSSKGGVRDELLRLDTAEEHFTTEKELFEHLYEQAGTNDYTQAEVDEVLAEVLSEGEAGLLLQYLLENSDGALLSYLEKLDLEATGIGNSEDLLRHLESVAEAEGFTMEEVRKAMMESLDSPLEVSLVHKELLKLSQGSVRQILETLDLKKEGILRVDQLIELIHRELEKEGLSRNEREQILEELFGDSYKEGPGRSRFSRSGPVILAVAITGLICLFIIWWRRRGRREKNEE